MRTTYTQFLQPAGTVCLLSDTSDNRSTSCCGELVHKFPTWPGNPKQTNAPQPPGTYCNMRDRDEDVCPTSCSATGVALRAAAAWACLAAPFRLQIT